MHFGHIFAIRLADCQQRLARSELTAIVMNIQISAEICKEQTQIKNADTKTLIDNLQFAECSQLQQTPIFKYGGGGARAAWRIRIRRPRLAERGFKACQIFSRTSADSKSSDGPRPTRRPRLQNRLCQPSGPKMQIFDTLFADRKFIKNRTHLKPSQNFKNPILERQMSDF